ncbi:MAG: EamA family transporter [Chromatiales bacterium]|nr:EamA family transporter [Chromatiales bacterium]
MALWHRHAGLAYGAVFLGVLGHASSEVVAVASGVRGPEVSVWRFLLGAIGLVVVALLVPSARDLLTPLREQPWRIAWISVLGVTIGYLVFHWSLDYATVPQVATIVTVIPIFVAIANLTVNRQPIAAAKWLTGLAAVLGVALLVTDGYLARLAGTEGSFRGVLMALVSAALIGYYTVMIRPVIARYGALRITTVSLSLGALGLWLVVGLRWGIWVNPAELLDRPPEQATALVTLALWNTTITQFLWIGGLAAVPDITRGSYLFFLKPVIAAALAVVWLAQPLTLMQGLAIAVICAAVAVEAAWPRLARRAAGG